MKKSQDQAKGRAKGSRQGQNLVKSRGQFLGKGPGLKAWSKSRGRRHRPREWAGGRCQEQGPRAGTGGRGRGKGKGARGRGRGRGRRRGQGPGAGAAAKGRGQGPRAGEGRGLEVWARGNGINISSPNAES